MKQQFKNWLGTIFIALSLICVAAPNALATTVTEYYTYSGTVTSLLTTELNSLGSSTTYAISTVGGTSGAFTNSTVGSGLGAYTLLQIHLHLGAPASGSWTANTSDNMWFLYSVNGTYETGSTSVLPTRPPDVVFPLPASSSAYDVVLSNIVAPVGTFKVLFQNAGGQTTASSGNLVEVNPYTVNAQ